MIRLLHHGTIQDQTSTAPRIQQRLSFCYCCIIIDYCCTYRKILHSKIDWHKAETATAYRINEAAWQIYTVSGTASRMIFKTVKYKAASMDIQIIGKVYEITTVTAVQRNYRATKYQQ